MLFGKHKNASVRTDRILAWVVSLLAIISIVLTVITMIYQNLDPGLLHAFYSVHMSILLAFVLELVYRFIVAPERNPHLGAGEARMKLLTHPLTIIDYIVIAPLFLMIFGVDVINTDFVILRILRVTSLLNLFKVYRSSRIVRMLSDVVSEIWNELLVASIFAINVILITSVLIYHFEGGINSGILSFFDALYFSVISITTVGFGDISPVTLGGKLVTMISSFVGIGIVALPVGILSAGFFRAMREEKMRTDKKRKKRLKHWLHEEEEVELVPLD